MTAAKTAEAVKALKDEVEQVAAERRSAPAAVVKQEIKIGHAVRKGFDVGGKIMGWAGGIFAIVATVQTYRNRDANAGNSNAGPAPTGGRNR